MLVNELLVGTSSSRSGGLRDVSLRLIVFNEDGFERARQIADRAVVLLRRFAFFAQLLVVCLFCRSLVLSLVTIRDSEMDGRLQMALKVAIGVTGGIAGAAVVLL